MKIKKVEKCQLNHIEQGDYDLLRQLSYSYIYNTPIESKYIARMQKLANQQGMINSELGLNED